jgi:hypothetical protein
VFLVLNCVFRSGYKTWNQICCPLNRPYEIIYLLITKLFHSCGHYSREMNLETLPAGKLYEQRNNFYYDH